MDYPNINLDRDRMGIEMNWDEYRKNPEEYREVKLLYDLGRHLNRMFIIAMILIAVICGFYGYSFPGSFILALLISILVGLFVGVAWVVSLSLIRTRARLLEDTIKTRMVVDRLLSIEEKKLDCGGR